MPIDRALIAKKLDFLSELLTKVERAMSEFSGGSVLPTHQKAMGVNPWMNGFRCGVPLH